jgi:DNA-binding NtrC family response regulator
VAERIKVLVVDDEPAVAETTAALLADDFEVSQALNADAALAVLEATAVDVVCTDFNMPGTTGLQLLQQAVAKWPHLGCVLVTGYREYAGRADRANTLGYMLVVKPYEPRALIELVQRAGESARLKRKLTALSATLDPLSTAGKGR